MNHQLDRPTYLTRAHVKPFPRDVQDVLIEAVNEHGVRIRLHEGGKGSSHVTIMADSENKGQRIFSDSQKVSAKRPGEVTLRWLIPWLKRNVPTWDKKEEQVVDQQSVKDLEEEIASIEEKVEVFRRPTPADVAKVKEHTENSPTNTWVPSGEPGWEPWVSSNNKDLGFEYNPEVGYRCTWVNEDGTRCNKMTSAPNGIGSHWFWHKDPETAYAQRRDAQARSVVARRANKEAKANDMTFDNSMLTKEASASTELDKDPEGGTIELPEELAQKVDQAAESFRSERRHVMADALNVIANEMGMTVIEGRWIAAQIEKLSNLQARYDELAETNQRLSQENEELRIKMQLAQEGLDRVKEAFQL